MSKEGWVKTVTEVFLPKEKHRLAKRMYIDAPTVEDVRRELNWMVQAEKAYRPGTIFLTRRIA
jgi:hypothetical protein